MEIKLEIDNDVIILKIIGNLLANSVEDLKLQIAKLMEKNYLHVLLDMSRVDLIDSTGLGSFSHISRELVSRGGLLACFGLNENLRRIFHMTRFDQRVIIHETKNNGVNALLTNIGAKHA